jgi:hypothetical protein
MKRALILFVGIASLLVVGCGGPSDTTTDDAKTREILSKPPSLAGMAGKQHPRGAKQPAGSPAGGPAPATGQ